MAHWLESAKLMAKALRKADKDYRKQGGKRFNSLSDDNKANRMQAAAHSLGLNGAGGHDKT
jgi:hypothetical protein